MNRYNIHNIVLNPADFQYPADRKVSQLILSQPAFQKALGSVSKNSLERQLACIYRSSMAQLTPKIAPKIHTMLEEACGMFGVEVMPEVFLQRTYTLSVTMLGIEKPMLLISTELLRQLDEQMQWGVIASQVSGIRNGFSEIRFVEWLCNSSGLVPGTVSQPLDMLFRNWHKYLQFSYDRATFIAIGDFNAAMCCILAGEAPMEILKKVNFNDPGCDYMKQSREFLERTGHWTDRVRDVKAVTDRGGFYAARYMNLFQFAKEDYYDLVEGFWEG